MTFQQNPVSGGRRATLLASALAGALWLGGCGMQPMSPITKPMTASLSGASEVPAVTSAGTGSVDASLNSATNLLTWTVTYGGLSGAATAGHFHGPAMAGENAGVVVPLSGSLTSPIVGSATLTPAQATDLMAGRWYLNLHTAANPGGEIRGQVRPLP